MEQKPNKEDNPTVNWQGGPLLMTVGPRCFQGICTGTSASLNIWIETIQVISLKNLLLLWRMRHFSGIGIASIMEMRNE